MGRRIVLLIALVAFSMLAAAPLHIAEAHRDGCHRWHSCPSDNGTYVCGDLGYNTYCPNKPKAPAPAPQPVAPPQTVAPPQMVAPAPAVRARPIVEWRTYATDALFLSYWQRNGGLPVFGLAKTLKYNESDHDAQIFERNRLEFHLENAAPYDVQLGLLGEERLLQLGRVWQNEAKAEPQPGCRYFPETGHNLCEPFLSYWRQHGLEFDGKRGFSEAENLALFGYPITEATAEVGADGVSRPTQWFQRARFEDHGADGGVLLGLLGNEVYSQP